MVVEKVFVTPEEYLRREREAEFKSEYVNGEMIPMGDLYPTVMAGASTNHNLIKENVAIQVGSHVRSNGKGCRSMSSDQRVSVPTNSMYAYPDVVVVCGPNQYHNNVPDTITNPMLIVEVLSPGTAGYDRGDKFALYRHADTLTEYLLIDSEKIRAEVYRKHEQGYWFLASEADKSGEAIELASIDLSLPILTIYDETEVELAGSTSRTATGREQNLVTINDANFAASSESVQTLIGIHEMFVGPITQFMAYEKGFGLTSEQLAGIRGKLGVQ